MANNDEIMRAIGKLEGKCDQIIDAMKAHFDRMNRIDADIQRLESRIRIKEEKMDHRIANLEKKQYLIITCATGVWAIIMMGIRKFFV
jgi:hypothetical protein